MTNVRQFKQGQPGQHFELAAQFADIEERVTRELACISLVLESTAHRLQRLCRPMESEVQTLLDQELAELRQLTEVLQSQLRHLKADAGRRPLVS